MSLFNDNLRIDTTRAELGAGYNVFRFDQVGDSAVSVKQPQTTPLERVSYELKLIARAQDLDDKFPTNADVQGTLFKAGDSQIAALISETTFFANRSYLFATVVVETSVTSIPQPLIEKKYLPDNKDEDAIIDFYRKFGTHYVSSVLSGGKLVLWIEVELDDLASKAKFDSAVELPAGPFGDGAQFFDVLSKTLSNRRLDIRGSSVGGKPLPKEAKQELKIALGFALGFSELARQKPAVYEASLTPYYRIPNALPNMQTSVIQPAKNLENLSLYLEQYDDQLAVIAYADPGENPLRLPNAAVTKLFELKGALKEDRARIVAAWDHSDPREIDSGDSLQSAGRIKAPSWYEEQIQIQLRRGP